jgi:integrase/recombinase XerD
MLGSESGQASSYGIEDRHARAWIALQSDLLRAPNTISSYARGLDHFLHFCQRSNSSPIDVGRGVIAAYIRELSGPTDDAAGEAKSLTTTLANASIRHRLTVVRLFFDYLVEEGLRISNPVSRGQRGSLSGGAGRRGLIAVERRIPWIPSDDAWRAVLAIAKRGSARNRLMLALAYDCALRREELCALRTGDVDPAHLLLRVRAETTKTKQARVVPYSPVTADLYAAYLLERRRLSSARGPLFLSESTRNRAAPLSIWTWSKVIRQLGLDADVPELTTHTFRHLCLTDLARAGWDIHEIARFAGHRSVQSTLLYIHISARDLVEKLAKGMTAIHEQRLAQLRSTTEGVAPP